jgi:phosphoglycerate kinase
VKDGVSKMHSKGLREIDVKGKRVLVRVDFNVPIKEGKVKDTTRITETFPTLEYLLKNNAKVILMSHLGKAKGKPDPEFSLAPVAKKLEELSKYKVAFVNDCGSDEAVEMSKKMEPGTILLVENTRFYPGEEKNDPEFAKKLARLGDVYVNDAFGTAHRAHASTEGVAKLFPVVASGFLMQKEIDALGKILKTPERPFIAVVGGAKVSSKIDVLNNLLPIVDGVIIGGGMAFTFLKAKGMQVGKSLVEDDKLEIAKTIMKKADELKKKLYFPTDVVVALEMTETALKTTKKIGDMKADEAGYDIGPETVKSFSEVLKSAKTVLWNGPMGVFEMKNFEDGTKVIADVIANLKAVTIVGGGDSVAAVQKYGLKSKMTHVSTGGGASLEFLEGKALPGIAALER